MDAKRFLDRLMSSKYYNGQAIHIEELPPREAVFSVLEEPLPDSIESALAKMGITKLDHIRYRLSRPYGQARTS